MAPLKTCFMNHSRNFEKMSSSNLKDDAPVGTLTNRHHKLLLKLFSVPTSFGVGSGRNEEVYAHLLMAHNFAGLTTHTLPTAEKWQTHYLLATYICVSRTIWTCSNFTTSFLINKKERKNYRPKQTTGRPAKRTILKQNEAQSAG